MQPTPTETYVPTYTAAWFVLAVCSLSTIIVILFYIAFPPINLPQHYSPPEPTTASEPVETLKPQPTPGDTHVTYGLWEPELYGNQE